MLDHYFTYFGGFRYYLVSRRPSLGWVTMVGRSGGTRVGRETNHVVNHEMDLGFFRDQKDTRKAWFRI